MDLAQRMRGLLDTLDKALAATDSSNNDNDNDNGGGKENEQEDEEEAVAAAWEELQEHSENLDYALVFCQVGGLPTLFRYLQPGPSNANGDGQSVAVPEEARALPALSVLAALTQNNPRVQAEVLAYCAQQQIDLLALLCGLVVGTAAAGPADSTQERRRPRHSVRLRAKALHALSCTVRAPAPTPLEARFVAVWAQPLFRAALAPADGDAHDDSKDPDPDARVAGKALFLLQALLGADHADRARGDALGLPLLPLVVPYLRHGEVGVRHAAAAVVSELSNRLGGPGPLLASPAGPALREAMAERRAVIGALPAGNVEREEAADEARFWEVVEAGGRFLRDGETEGAACGGGQEMGDAGQGQQQGAEGEAPAPVLLLEPPKLAGASQAP